MKNLFFLLTIVSFLIVSCEKDAEVISKNTTDNNQSSFTFEQVNIDKEQSKENLAKIKAFKDRMESDTKEVEWLSEEDAEWLIEAAANYDYTEISEAYPQYDIDTFMYMVPRTTDGISSEDLETVYESISEDIEDVLASLEIGEDIEIVGVRVELNDIAGASEVQADIFVNMGFYPNEYVFTENNNDYWYWGEGLGKVDGTSIGDDATTQLTYSSNQAIINFLNPTNYSFTDNQYVTVYPADVPYQGASRIWGYDGPTSNQPHLTPTDMNYYLNQALWVAQLYKPSGKMIMYIHVNYGREDDYYHWQGIWYGRKWHSISIEYGTPNI